MPDRSVPNIVIDHLMAGSRMNIATSDVGIADFAAAILAVALAVAILTVVTNRWPRPNPQNHISAQAMRRLEQRRNNERVEHPGRET